MKKVLLIILVIVAFMNVIKPEDSVNARKLFYAEEFYLYVMNLYYDNPNLLRNIRFMQWALKAPFDDPVRSLAKITNECEFKRYRLLFKFHVTLLIVDSYLQLAHRFDKEHLYFFNYRYAKDIKESFELSKFFYNRALIYWNEAKKYIPSINKIPCRINLDKWEDEFYMVKKGDLNLEPIITDRMNLLDKRIAILTNYISKDSTSQNLN